MHIAVDSVRLRVKVIVGLIGRFMTLSFRTFSFRTGTIHLSRYGSLLEPIQYPVIRVNSLIHPIPLHDVNGPRQRAAQFGDRSKEEEKADAFKR